METLYRWSKFVDEDQLEEWEARLIMAEVPFTAEKPINRKRWQLSSYAISRDHADQWRAQFGGGVTEVRPMDWQPSAESGAESVLKIRDALVVCEAEDESVWQSFRDRYPNRIVLSFPPQLAFGTGGHPTTAGCLRFLADIAKERAGRDWKLLDLGSGSGILAIAAAKLGASEVVAVEIDDMAMRYAKQNAERHGVSDQIRFLEGDAVEMGSEGRLGTFDVVAANLFSSLLVSLFPAVASFFVRGGEKGRSGDLVISGFLTSQTREVNEAAREAGFRRDDFLRRGQWVAARGQPEAG
ncbi:MAG: 50S ribosomal protein L11 methyltransferase [Verrucomicrobiota bacterium]